MTTLQHMRRKLKNPLVVRDMSLGLITKIFRWLFVIGMCYVFLFPILYIISVAFRAPSSVNDPQRRLGTQGMESGKPAGHHGCAALLEVHRPDTGDRYRQHVGNADFLPDGGICLGPLFLFGRKSWFSGWCS